MSDREAHDDNPYVEDPPTTFDPVDGLGRDEAALQAEQLREAIRYHDRRYYVDADPSIPDRDYDALFDRLQAIEDAYDLETDDSPTRRVGGAALDELETVEHVAPMLSIDSSGEAEDVREFARRVREGLGLAQATGDADGQASLDGYAGTSDDATDTGGTDTGGTDTGGTDTGGTDTGGVRYFCEPKFDGVSVEVVYRDGRFERAATRGDGYEGDDITENVRTVRSVPQRLSGDYPEFLALRGEVFMPREAFQQYNRERVERGDDPFANPRNATAGTVRQLDPGVTAERPLDCYFFDVLESSRAFESFADIHDTVGQWGLKTTDRTVLVDDVEDAIAYRDRLVEDRDDLDYEVDGAVIKVNDRAQCERLGSTSRAPRWAFAYKLPARKEETTVRDIVVQVGRTGRLTPVALLDPVDVGGVTVSRASLHNPDQIEELGVDVGDRVRVLRAGDVIPYVDEVVDAATDRHFAFPETCPVCDSPVHRDGPLAFCTGGLACPMQRRRAIEHYVSRTGLDIEGLGAERIDQLVDAGLLETLPDLYDLAVDDLAALEGWGERSAQNLVDEIDDAREPALADFLTALGVPEVGPTVARNLARHFGSFDAVLDADADDLEAVEDVGPTIAAEIREFFENDDNRAVIDALDDRGVDPQAEATATGDALSGLTFVFTGSVEGYTRSDLTELVERHGANATSSVSGNTDYLVAGDNPGQSKRDDANANDVPVVDPEAFFDLLDDRGVTVDTADEN